MNEKIQQAAIDDADRIIASLKTVYPDAQRQKYRDPPGLYIPTSYGDAYVAVENVDGYTCINCRLDFIDEVIQNAYSKEFPDKSAEQIKCDVNSLGLCTGCEFKRFILLNDSPLSEEMIAEFVSCLEDFIGTPEMEIDVNFITSRANNVAVDPISLHIPLLWELQQATSGNGKDRDLLGLIRNIYLDEQEVFPKAVYAKDEERFQGINGYPLYYIASKYDEKELQEDNLYCSVLPGPDSDKYYVYLTIDTTRYQTHADEIDKAIEEEQVIRYTVNARDFEFGAKAIHEGFDWIRTSSTDDIDFDR